MKNSVFSLIAAAFLCLAAAGCQKSGKDVYRGEYSFKTSGYLTAVCEFSREEGGSSKTDVIILELNTESGQMDISDMGGDDVLVSMNCIPGGIKLRNATVAPDRLVINPTVERTSYTFKKILPEIESSDFTVKGEGKKYEDILVFNLEYSGTISYLGNYYAITESHVICRAKENK